VKVFIYINGIDTFPGDTRNWNARAVTWTHTRLNVNVLEDVHEGEANVAEKVEYFCGPIGAAFGQDERADKLVELLEEYRKRPDCEIHIAAHSNGAKVTLEGLKLLGWPTVKSLHLVCAVCEADFRWNGLNDALWHKRVGRVHVYRGGRDWALKLAHTWPAKLLGYGILGLHGPRQVWREFMVDDRVVVMDWPDFGHGTCWEPKHFDRTMRHLTSRL
jgi:hypothetical protein